MDQAKGGVPPIDDIPEARREGVKPLQRSLRRSRIWPWALGSVTAIAILVGSLLLVPPNPSEEPQPLQPASGINAGELAGANSTLPTSGEEALVPTPDSLLGHRAFEEAPAEDLVPLTADSRVRLRRAAAEKFQEMAAAAAADGVILAPLSGFRSQAEQTQLFFEVKADRGQSPTTRAEVSAPPGYSEHHTGYALDIGDGRRPGTDVETTFEQTDAFRWLQQNAAYYGFEISFDRNNDQGVAYEPWHWRFVGDRDSLETFYQRGPAAPLPSTLRGR